MCGVAMATSMPPFFPWAIFFCYLPLWFLVYRSSSLKQVFQWGWITQFIFAVIGLHWVWSLVSTPSSQEAFISWPQGVLFYGMAYLYIPLALSLGWFLTRTFRLSLPASFFVQALSLIFGERLWPTPLPWNLAYGVFWAKWPIYQYADLFGFDGLSALLLLFQAALGSAFFISQRRKLIFLAGLALFLGLLHVGGIQREFAIKELEKQASQSLRVGLVQAGPFFLKEFKSHDEAILTRDHFNEYLQKSILQVQSSVAPLDLIVWPEGAIVSQVNSAKNLKREVLKNLNTPLLAGSYLQQEGSVEILSKNVASLYNEKGELVDSYQKTRLVPFVEHVPLLKSFPWLYRIFGNDNLFEPGEGPRVLKLPFENKNINLGVQICYESLFSSLARTLALQKADILVNITNDAWFEAPSEPYQHLIFSLARAIEIRKPIVRAAKTGISAVMLASGEVILESPFDQVWSQAVDVPLMRQHEETTYVKYGNWDLLVWVMISLVALFYFQGLEQREIKPTSN